ncbi:LuxR C-terminal-related transcriptional regulator [Enterobacter sp. UNJFSC 003]|uniref:LuxR C-terminal-related transcriptional regulator n=1 Tax=Enterobacter sp. UNJFSC 003 TaxID=3122077 RepID=UPI002EBB6D78|nr:LuxR C-terminal-related transcriptional regulator [Serratia liquefaciens]
MLNIVIHEADLFFQAGLHRFFGDFFSHNFKQQVTFFIELSHDNVSRADIIVLSLCQGETLICFPELRARQKGIVIGLVDNANHHSALPACFQDMIFITRNASVDRMYEALFIAWSRTQQAGYRWNKTNCFECQHKMLSPQQIRIMVNFYRGLSVTDVADELQISDKTVFTHKYMMMQKFNLRSDYELMTLLKRLVEKNSRPNMLRDYLDNNDL